MIPNNNLSVLPFYDSVEKQNHRKDYAFGDIFSLLTPDRKILPFQIIRPHAGSGINSVVLRNVDGSSFLNITAEILATGLKINSYASSGYDIILYDGILPMPITTPEGLYYLEIHSNTVFYSEVFNIVRNLDSCLKIVYSDEESLLFEGGMIDYTGIFKFNIYLPTQLGRPDYEFEEQEKTSF